MVNYEQIKNCIVTYEIGDCPEVCEECEYNISKKDSDWCVENVYEK